MNNVRLQMKTSGEPVISRTLQATIVSFLIILPLAFNPWGYNGYSFIKTFLLYAFALTTFAGVAIASLREGKIVYPSHSLPLLLLLTGLVASTALSIHPKTSLFGEYTRFEGLLTWITYLWMFYLGYLYAAHRGELRWVDLAFRTTAVLVSMYAIAQWLGLDTGGQTAPWRSTVPRSFSTLGNPSTLGAYLALVLPICALGLARSEKLSGKLVRGASTILVLLGLATTLSLGGWIGAAVGLLVALVIEARREGVKPSYVVALIIVALIALVASNSVNGDFSDIAAVKESTAQSRLMLWEQTLNLVKERPVFGWGVDSFQLAFPTYMLERAKAGDIGLSSMGESADFALKAAFTTDNAHNFLLQFAATAGSLALFFLLWFLVFYFWRSLIYLKQTDGDDRNLVTVIVAGLIGYGIALMFHFSTVGVTPLALFLLGAGFGLVVPEDRYIPFKPQRIGFTLQAALGLVCLATLIALSAPVVSDMYIRQSVELSSQGYVADAFERYDHAIALHPWEEEVPFMKARHISAYMETSKNYLEFGHALEMLDNAKGKNPRDLVIRAFKVKLLDQAPFLSSIDPSHITEGQSILNDLTELNPSDPKSIIR